MKPLLLIAALAALGACQRIERSAYPAEYRTAFITSCQVQGETEAHCLCVYDKVQANISQSDFEAMDLAAQSGESHPLAGQIAQYSAECRAS